MRHESCLMNSDISKKTLNMANYTQREWRMSQSNSKSSADLGQTAALGGATLALFAYIIYHFVYPLIAKGLLF